MQSNPPHPVTPSEDRSPSEKDSSSCCINLTKNDDVEDKECISVESREPLSSAQSPPTSKKTRHFFQGGVRKQHAVFVRWMGRIGFVAKGTVYGVIGVLTCTNVTGAWTPNGSQDNESPQGAFLLLGGIPFIGRPVLVVMAIGLLTYVLWRFWESLTGQGCDASFSKKANFFRYRLSPFVSGCVYTAYSYYLIQMIYQTSDEQQQTASSKEFPASWTTTTLGKAGLGILGIAFVIACITQLVNAITGNFIRDLRSSDFPPKRRWEARIVHTMGRIGFCARAMVFGTLSGFFWESLAKEHQSGRQNMVAAAISKLASTGGGRFFMMVLGIGLVDYAVFAIANAYYKYFPTPPPSRRGLYTDEAPSSSSHAALEAGGPPSQVS